MAYATGSITTANELVDAISSFAQANGWTLDLAAADGSNKRLHIHKGSVYANISSNYVTSNYLLGLALSASFVGAGNAWNNQGAPRSADLYIAKNGSSSASMLPATYYLFAQTNPDFIGVVVVSSNNEVRYFMFGILNKVGTYTGGEFLTGGAGFYDPILMLNMKHMYEITVKDAATYINPYLYGVPPGVDNDTSLSPLIPVAFFKNVSGAYKPLGNIDWVRLTGKSYINASEVTYGADTWMVFNDDIVNCRSQIAFKK